MLIAAIRNKFIVSFIVIFGTLSFHFLISVQVPSRISLTRLFTPLQPCVTFFHTFSLLHFCVAFFSPAFPTICNLMSHFLSTHFHPCTFASYFSFPLFFTPTPLMSHFLFRTVHQFSGIFSVPTCRCSN